MINQIFIIVGLEPLNGFQESKSASPVGDKLPTETNDDASIPMEIDADTSSNDIQNVSNDASTEPQVDLESELREFLESDTTSLAAAAADDVGIDQMMLMA